MIKSIRTRINIYYSAVFFLLLLFLFIIMQTNLKEYLLKKIKKQMKLNVLILDKYLDEKYLKNINESATFQKKLSFKLKNMKDNFLTYRITIILKNGVVLADSDSQIPSLFENHKYRKEIVEARKKTFGSSLRHSDTFKMGMLYVAYYNNRYTLRISRQLDDVYDELNSVNRLLLLAGFILLSITFIISLIINWYITRPINTIINFTKMFKNGNFSKRIPVLRNDEIGLLQVTINDMAQSIENLIRVIKTDKIRLENIISTITEALILINQNGKIALVNPEFKKMFQQNSDIIGIPYYQVINSNQLNDFIENGLKIKKKNKKIFDLFEINETNIEVTLLPFENNEGLLLIIRDITNQIKFDKMKNNFIANASHELKTPISIISGFIQTLSEKPEPNKKTRDLFLKRITSNITRLESIISDITTLNKIEQGQKYYNKKKIKIHKIIQSIILSLKSKADEKSIDIKIRNNAKSEILLANKDLIESLFYNIIVNGINYNHNKGTITITIDEDNNNFITRIMNTGIGFEKSEAEKIFERFYRIDSSRSREIGGTGLGLSIVKHSAIIHSGSVTASSEGIGKGAEFIVTLPKE